MYGEKGEVVGPATREPYKGDGLEVRFPGLSPGHTSDCYLAQLSREALPDPASRDRARSRWAAATAAATRRRRRRRRLRPPDTRPTDASANAPSCQGAGDGSAAATAEATKREAP